MEENEMALAQYHLLYRQVGGGVEALIAQASREFLMNATAAFSLLGGRCTLVLTDETIEDQRFTLHRFGMYAPERV